MSVVYQLLLMDLYFHRGFGFLDILIPEPSQNFVLEKLILLSCELKYISAGILI